MRRATSIYPLLAAVLLAAPPPLGAEESTIDTRVDLSQIYTGDSETDRHISFNQLRSTLDTSFGSFEFHLDGRGRLSYEGTRETEEEITRLYFQYGHDKDRGRLALGRQTVASAASARLDGILGALRLSNSLVLDAFAGLMPHPVTGDFNADFATCGIGYRLRDKTIQNLGGLVFQTYDFELDRVYLSERLLWNPGPQWTVFAFAIVDFFSPRGILADLVDDPSGDPSGVERIDLINGQVMVRYRPSRRGDLRLNLSHHHTILPSVWWRDWLERERERRGFIVDGEDPIGTRKSSARLTGTLHIGRFLSPYLIARYDHRHNDDRPGYEGRAGLKANLGGTGFADVFYSYRRHFIADNHLVSARGGFDLLPAVTLDAGAAALFSRPLESDRGDMFYDLEVSLWIDLGRTTKSLKGVLVLLQYQAFFDPGMVYHLGHARLVYRYRS